MYGETSGVFKNGYPERLYNWVDRIPPRHRVVVGHAVLSVDAPVEKKGDEGGSAIFLDTGSSKDITFDNGNIEPQRGHLSWLDFTIDSRGLLMKEYGRE